MLLVGAFEAFIDELHDLQRFLRKRPHPETDDATIIIRRKGPECCAAVVVLQKEFSVVPVDLELPRWFVGLVDEAVWRVGGSGVEGKSDVYDSVVGLLWEFEES